MSLSIKYKIMLALAGLTGLVLILYIFVAKKVFEEDKVAYVFDSSLEAARSRADYLNNQLTSIVSVSKVLVLGYDFEKNAFAATGDYLFTTTDEIVGLYATDVQKPDTPLIAQSKKAGLLQEPRSQEIINKLKSAILTGLELHPLNSALGQFVIALPVVDNANNIRRNVMVFVNLPNFIGQFQSTGIYEYALTDLKGNIIGGDVAPNKVKDLKNATMTVDFEKTGGRTGLNSLAGKKHILSMSTLNTAPYVVAAAVPEAEALKALQSLYSQSVKFFVFVIGIILIISLLLAKGLTRNLEDLTDATALVAKGDFEVDLKVTTKDEVGMLSQSFLKMAQEIKRLLFETAEKARMEGELQTAKTVQETLFPPSIFTHGKISGCGLYVSASECGGDWWFHYAQGPNLFVIVADATGHGAPAALVTSAARSAFSVLSEMSILSLQDVATIYNRAIFDTSKGKILMTAFMAKINTETLECEYINASHEPPYWLKKSGLADGEVEFLMDPNNPRIGESREMEFQAGKAQFSQGDTFLFYTDGVTSLESPQGKGYGDKRFLKTIVKQAQESSNPQAMVEKLTAEMEKFKGSHISVGLPDDITVVALEIV